MRIKSTQFLILLPTSLSQRNVEFPTKFIDYGELQLENSKSLKRIFLGEENETVRKLVQAFGIRPVYHIIIRKTTGTTINSSFFKTLRIKKTTL